MILLDVKTVDVDDRYNFFVRVLLDSPLGFIVVKPPVFGGKPYCYPVATHKEAADKIWELYCKEQAIEEDVRDLIVQFEDFRISNKPATAVLDRITEEDRRTIREHLVELSKH